MLTTGLHACLWGQGTDPVLVVTGNVCSTEYSRQQTFVGNVEAIRQTIVGSAVAGRVRTVDIDRGSSVRGPQTDASGQTVRGQVLAQLDTGTLEIEIGSARIQRDLALQAQQELELGLPVEIRLAEARLQAAEARKQFSQSEWERLNRLEGNSGAVSRTEIGQARSQAGIDTALAAEARNDLERLQSTADIRKLQAESRVRAAEQELLRLEDQKGKFTLHAPFDGFVVNKLTETGAWIQIGDPMVEIVQLDAVDFVFPVPQEFVTPVQQSLSAARGPTDSRPLVNVLIDGIDESFAGQLSSLAPQVDIRSRQVGVRVRIANRLVGDLPLLKPGMIGRASLPVGDTRSITVVSRDAVVLGGVRPMVYKVTGTGETLEVVAVPVELGENSDGWIEVRGNLGPGDRVAVEGNERLRNGSRIRVSRHRDEMPEAVASAAVPGDLPAGELDRPGPAGGGIQPQAGPSQD